MIPAPFEVVPTADGFAWRLIGACGRPLVYSTDTFPSDRDAAIAAREARARHCEIARTIDGGVR